MVISRSLLNMSWTLKKVLFVSIYNPTFIEANSFSRMRLIIKSRGLTLLHSQSSFFKIGILGDQFPAPAKSAGITVSDLMLVELILLSQ